jgi:hypothetical protein
MKSKMSRSRSKQLLASAVLITALALQTAPGWAQTTPASPNAAFEQPDAQRTHEQLSQLLDRYPPSLENLLELDPSLLNNQTFLAPYPELAAFLSAHPDIAHNPAFYFNRNRARISGGDHRSEVIDVWKGVLGGLGAFIGFGMAIGFATWLIRSFIDYRRWNRLTKVQTDVHTKLLDRFSQNEDLLAYIQSPAGSKFLESSPITLDAGPRSIGAPFARILWSIQAGLVLAAAGTGLEIVSYRFTDDVTQPLHAIGVLAIAIGIGFVLSAVVSYFISRRLGLIEASPAARFERPGMQS